MRVAPPRKRLGTERTSPKGWMVKQAYEGLLRAIECENDVRRTGHLAKLAIAELAESALSRICRVIGGSSYSLDSPFGFWLEDVRALGVLTPPWSLAHAFLAETDGSTTWTPQPGRPMINLPLSSECPA